MDEKKEQYFDPKDQALYTFGEYTIEVDFVTVDEVPAGWPFSRVKAKPWSDGEWKNESLPRKDKPCKHPGCLSHVSHPCEGCGRIAGGGGGLLMKKKRKQCLWLQNILVLK